MTYSLTAVLKLQDEISRPMRLVTRQMESATKAADSFRDANGRLRDANGRFVKSTDSATTAVSGFSANTNSAIGVVTTLATTIGTAIGAAKLLDATLGEAMKYEQSTIVIEAMFDDTKLAKQYNDMLNKFAIDSPILNSSDMFANSKSFISLSDDMGQLEKMWELSERLLAVDPSQGVEGAVLALRELFSGDTQSLVERFELPRKALNDIKNLSLSEQLVELDKLFNKMNMTNELVTKMGESSLGIISRMKEALAVKLRNTGLEALEKVKPILMDIEKAVSNGKLDGFFKGLTTGFGVAATEAAKLSDYIKTNWPTILSNFNQTKETLAPVGGALTLLYDGAKKAGDYVVQDWPVVEDAIVGVATAVTTYKAAMVGLLVVETITGLMKSYQAVAGTMTVAQWALNGAMAANPLGLIAAGIAAVVTAGVLLYRNWDVVKEKTAQLWDKFGEFNGVSTMILGPIGFIIRAAVDLAKNWDNTRSVWDNVWSSIKRSAQDSVNSVVDSINLLIDKINMIPGVSIPLVPKVDWTTAATRDLSSVSKAAAATSTATKTFQRPTPFRSEPIKFPSAVKGFYHGIENVKQDRMPAYLHKGERVMTAAENKEYSSGGGKNIVNLTFHYNGGSTLNEQEMERLGGFIVRKVSAAVSGGA